MMTRPIQNADMLPATNPDRSFNGAPPCREQLVTSLTCMELVLVKIFVNSGINAPATVPQLMMQDNTHHRSGWMPGWPRSSTRLAKNVTAMDNAEVIQTRCVSGASKSKSFRFPYFALLTTVFRK